MRIDLKVEYVDKNLREIKVFIDDVPYLRQVGAVRDGLRTGVSYRGTYISLDIEAPPTELYLDDGR